jgi:hypothetical protein
MKYLRQEVTLPGGYEWYDAARNKTLLDVEVSELDGRKVSGTTDVVIAKQEHVVNNAVRHHISVQLELKKDTNTGNHEPQVCLEHLAASVLNRQVPVLTVLTDLQRGWVFYWFGRTSEGMAAIKKLDLNGNFGCAIFLLENFVTDIEKENLPETFVDRLSWKEVCDLARVEGSTLAMRKGDDGEHPGNSPDSKGASGDDDRDGKNSDDLSSSSAGEKSSSKKPRHLPPSDNLTDSLRWLNPGGDLGNELDLLDMMDESERIRTVRAFLAKRVVPYITGGDPQTLWTDHSEEGDAQSFLSAANLAHHDGLPQMEDR